MVMEKMKILVVDDESRMRKLVKDFLVKSNYEVLEAGDGVEALDVFFENKGSGKRNQAILKSANYYADCQRGRTG